MSLTIPDTKPRRSSIPPQPPTTSTNMKTRSSSASKILLITRRSESSSSVIKKRSLKRKCSKSQGISLNGCGVLRDDLHLFACREIFFSFFCITKL